MKAAATATSAAAPTISGSFGCARAWPQAAGHVAGAVGGMTATALSMDPIGHGGVGPAGSKVDYSERPCRGCLKQGGIAASVRTTSDRRRP